MASIKQFVVQDLKIRLDKFLAEHNPDISRSRIQRDIEAGMVTVNQEIITSPSFVVRKDSTVEYGYTPDVEPLPVNLPLKTVYNNHGLLIIDKPAGLVVHPGAGFKGDSLAQALLYHFKDIYLVGEEGRNGIVHRLDKDTSGVMMVALNPHMYEYLKDAFGQRRVKKEYIALVKGKIPQSHGLIDADVGKSKKDFRKYTVNKADMVLAKPSLTEYWVLETLKISSSGKQILLKDNEPEAEETNELGEMGRESTPRVPHLKETIDYYTIIRVKLHTGRTHQIRVHLSSLGFPLVGDKLYGGKSVMTIGKRSIDRQFLHAARIEVQLPDGLWVEGTSKLPKDLRQILKDLHSEKVTSL